MPQTVEEIISRLKEIRDIVEANPSKTHEYFRKYYELMCDLSILDPKNSELQIGIHGRPYSAGLKD
jgi:hypothetical protein